MMIMRMMLVRVMTIMVGFWWHLSWLYGDLHVDTHDCGVEYIREKRQLKSRSSEPNSWLSDFLENAKYAHTKSRNRQILGALLRIPPPERYFGKSIPPSDYIRFWKRFWENISEVYVIISSYIWYVCYTDGLFVFTQSWGRPIVAFAQHINILHIPKMNPPYSLVCLGNILFFFRTINIKKDMVINVIDICIDKNKKNL